MRPYLFLLELARMPRSNILGCPERPPCPNCGTSMIIIGRKIRRGGFEWCAYQCLKCRHIETSEPGLYGITSTHGDEELI